MKGVIYVLRDKNVYRIDGAMVGGTRLYFMDYDKEENILNNCDRMGRCKQYISIDDIYKTEPFLDYDLDILHSIGYDVLEVEMEGNSYSRIWVQKNNRQ